MQPRHAFQRPKFSKAIFGLQIFFALLLALITITTILRLYSAGLFFNNEDACTLPLVVGDFAAPTAQQIAALLAKISELHAKVGKAVEEIDEQGGKDDGQQQQQQPSNPGMKQSRLLLLDVVMSLDLVKTFLLRLKLSGMQRLPLTHGGSNLSLAGVQAKVGGVGDSLDGESAEEEREIDPLVEFFEIEEIRKYLRVKENRHKKTNFLGANATVGAIGHACVLMKAELEQYMGYDVGDLCEEDWHLAQKLMVNGCDPLPRRRCLARAPPLYQKPFPRNESLWKTPDDRNVRWGKYACRNFQCLRNSTKRGFFKCGDCFDLAGEAKRWVTNSSFSMDFQIAEILSIKPGEIRIGLDYGLGVGTFAARMLEHNVTIVSATLNIGAPFSEMIALRGLVPLYISLNQRLPFFDNTLDILHSTLFFDGWIDLQFLDFVIFDWDRVLRPGGLLWIDRFFCDKDDMQDYLYIFLQLRYKKHKWAITPKLDKDGKEVYFSAVLEKPPRPF